MDLLTNAIDCRHSQYRTLCYWPIGETTSGCTEKPMETAKHFRLPTEPDESGWQPLVPLFLRYGGYANISL